jgi:hypothetical protein
LAATSVRVKGLRELTAAFRKMETETWPELRRELQTVAKPVAESAKAKISVYRGASLGTIRPVALTRSVFVRQTKRKVTGQRPDYGSLQMRHGLLPALEENTDQIISGFEDMIDRLASRNGF